MTAAAEQTPAGGAPPQGGAPAEEKITISKAELDKMTRERDEAKASEKYWANLARGNGGQPVETAAEAEDEIDLDLSEFLDDDAPTGMLADDTPEKLVADLAKDGVAALKKRGYVSAADAQRIAVEAATKVAAKISRQTVNNQRVKDATDNELTREFPDLQNPETELFKETAKIYRGIVAKDPNAQKSPAALILSARLAKTALDARRGPEETEEDRLARIDAQDGRARTRGEAVDDDMLGDEAKQIIKAMNIKEEDYKAERKKIGADRPARRTR